MMWSISDLRTVPPGRLGRNLMRFVSLTRSFAEFIKPGHDCLRRRGSSVESPASCDGGSGGAALWVLMGAVGGFSVTKLLSSHDSVSIMSKLIHSPHWTWVDQFSLFIYSLVIYLFI